MFTATGRRIAFLDGELRSSRSLRCGVSLSVWFLLLSILSPLVAAESTVPDNETLQNDGARIGEIIIQVGDIFNPDDPKEARRFHRWANRLHRRTREAVIRRELLFRPGDRYDPRLLEESERLLRGLDFLYDASIETIRYQDGSVTVRVRTRDVWTLRLGIGFSRSGGSNDTSIGLRDVNLLGTGKEVLLERESNVDRTTTELRYVDPNIAGSRIRLFSSFIDSDDGSGTALTLERPFYALDTRRAGGFRWERLDSVETFWSAGETVAAIEQERIRAEFYWGRSDGWKSGKVRRFLLGLAYEHDAFLQQTGDELFLTDRTFIYPWIEFSGISDKFLEMNDLDSIRRTEDLNLGSSWSVRFGRTADTWLYRATANRGWRVGQDSHSLWQMHSALEGRHSGGQTENLILEGGLRLDRRNFGRHLFHASVRASGSHSLDADRQLRLGGDSGLRGYPLRYLEGESTVVFTVEQRFYTDWHPFHLARVGAAIFADAGRVWNPQFDTTPDGWLSDIGIGLRVGSSISSEGAMVHLDLAFPLDRADGIHGLQFLVSTRDRF